MATPLILQGIATAMAFGLDYFEAETRLSKLTGLPSSIGFVGLALIFNTQVLFYLGGKVMKARKLYNVEYPTMYATKAENKYAKEFNCYQRGHQNALEGMQICFKNNIFSIFIMCFVINCTLCVFSSHFISQFFFVQKSLCEIYVFG